MINIVCSSKPGDDCFVIVITLLLSKFNSIASQVIIITNQANLHTRLS